MSLNVSHDEAVERIAGNVYAAIEGASKMMDVDMVVRGDRHEGPTPEKTVWVFDDMAQCIHNRGLTETWNLKVHIVAVVSGGEPGARKRKAASIIARCMSVVVSNRRLGLDFVQDVTKERMMFAPPRQSENKLLSAVAGVINVMYNIREKGV